MLINSVFAGVFMIGALASLNWGTQYLFGSLIGLLGLTVSIILTVFLSRNFKKGVVARSWAMFFVRIIVWTALILVPLFTSNTWNNPSGGVSLVYEPINIWAIIIFLSIPLFSTFVTNWCLNRKLSKKR